MSFDGIFRRIGSSGGPPSLPESIFRDRLKGVISSEDYYIHNARWVAENTQKYPFRGYPELAHDPLEYAKARVNRVRETRDAAFHKRIGLWVQAIRALIEQHESDHGLLVWSLEKCQVNGLSKHAASLELKLSEFVGGPKYLDLALKCLGLDCEEKQRDEKEARRRA